MLIRNLWYFRLAGLAAVAGMAVATAVLTGALMVGDSVRGSLREMAVQRLGPVDYALVGSQFFREDLAQRLAASPAFRSRFETCVPGIWLRGGVADERGRSRAGGVQIAALGDWIPSPFGTCILNGQVADALNVKESGGTVLLSFPIADDTPRDSAMARRGRNDVASGMRVRAASIARNRDMASLFSLTGGQRLSSNVWVNLKELQAAVGQNGRANTLLVKSNGDALDPQGPAALGEALRQVAQLDDYGLQISRSGDGREAVLGSRSTYIPPAVSRAATEAAQALNLPLRHVLVYLVNHVVKVSEGDSQPATVHYAIAAGIDPMEGGPLGDDEVALNAWMAQHLSAQVGDRIRLDYYQRQSNGELREVRSDAPGAGLVFRVARIIPMEGLGADKTLTPTYQGLTDAESVSDWQPPEGLEIDKKLVTEADEAYWHKYKAAPKIFLNLTTARRLWGGTYGDTNSIRIPAARASAFAAELRSRLNPSELGLAFQPIRAQQLAAASGSTEFSGLFIGLSFFLIVAAALLMAMLLRLGIEQRARQFGLLAAVGFTPRAILGLTMAEGMLQTTVGGLIGIGGAVGYTWLMMAGLRTWWVGAVGTTALRLHVVPVTLAAGFVASMAIASIAVTWAVWRVGKAHAATLLAGGWGTSLPQRRARRRVSTVVGAISLVAGLALLGAGVAGWIGAQAAFMGGGAMLLVGSLCLLGGRLGAVRREVAVGHWSVERMGVRNAARHPARSIVTISLIAFATFVLVTVAAMRQQPPTNTHERSSGTGGYQLVLRADVPLLGDLNTPKGRDLLGIRETVSPLWERARFMPMRLWAGQDISCLNLTRPHSPTILGVPAAMIQRGGFAFARTLEPAADPWQLLRSPSDPNDPVPVIADDETATYILKLGLGQTLPIIDQRGQPRQLRLVATFSHSIFQGELLMAETDFVRLFPLQSGAGMILAEAEDGDLPELRRLLAGELEDFSITIESTADRLARYQDVANTYLSTFQTLGSLGLMLGTIGLAVILLRSLVERQAELALLAAIGFNRSLRLRLVLSENIFLLLLGLGVGGVCALVGVLPAITASTQAINWPQLAFTLVAVLIIGLSVMATAVWFGGRVKPAGLQAE